MNSPNSTWERVSVSVCLCLCVCVDLYICALVLILLLLCAWMEERNIYTYIYTIESTAKGTRRQQRENRKWSGNWNVCAKRMLRTRFLKGFLCWCLTLHVCTHTHTYKRKHVHPPTTHIHVHTLNLFASLDSVSLKWMQAVLHTHTRTHTWTACQKHSKQRKRDAKWSSADQTHDLAAFVLHLLTCAVCFRFAYVRNGASAT